MVDTRNVHGQSRKVFGRGLRPDPQGIRKALRKYGFEAVEIYAGVATKTMHSAPSDMVRFAVEQNKQYAVRIAQQDAVVLSGHLAERNGEMEEKQVDVLLALKVADLADRAQQLGAPFECIVVLSEDMDLMPSYEFARQRGVHVYAAAHDTIHTRDDQTKWLIFDESSLRMVCPPPASLALGAPMRIQIARMATTPAPDAAPSWKVESWHVRNQQIVLSNSRGITGILHERPSKQIRKGDRLHLYADGIEMEANSKRFPMLTLSRVRPTEQIFDGIVQAEVLYWVQPTRARIQIDGGNAQATITASPGHLMAGQRIVVWQTREDDRTATYYIGPSGQTEPNSVWPLDEPFGIVTVIEAHSKSVWRCTLDGTSVDVLVPKNHLDHAGPGSRLRVALAGVAASGRPIGQPLTCCLLPPGEKLHKIAPLT